MEPITYQLPEKCAIKFVTIRRTNGVDEEQAAIAAEAGSVQEKHFLTEASIVAVNGNPVIPGDTGYRQWPTKTRNVVSKLSDRVNSVEKKILFPFIQKAEEEDTDVVDGRVQTKFHFPEGFGLKWVVLREMMEADERAAISVNKSGGSTDALIRRCIVETDLGGELSKEQMLHLDSRTRSVLSTYWAGMNFVQDEEIDPLAREAETKAQQVSADESEGNTSPTGSGSPAPADAA